MPTNNELYDVEYKRILYVTDLSESGRKAFPHAAGIARRCNADLTVFHVVENREMDDLLGYVSDSLWEELTKSSLEEARQILIERKRDNFEIRNNLQQDCDDYLSGSKKGSELAYEVKVESGERIDTILTEAHNGHYDLLVISKHGNRNSFQNALVGDTTRRILRHCKIPVLVIPLED